MWELLDSLLLALDPYQPILEYGSIPVLAALVGWGTNVLALKMTFYPLEFVGVRPWFGWQGIIPAKARKMASTTVDLMTTHLVQVREVVGRLEADRVYEALGPDVDAMIRQTIDEVLSETQPELWRSLPEAIKEEIYRRAQAETPRVIEESLRDIQEEIEQLLDLKATSIDALVKDKDLLNQIFLQCGEKEFRFIERSGVFFGLLFGLVQMGIWFFYKGDWMMPVMGFVVGWITNWLALQMIFAPREPVRLGPLVWQGLFFIRQKEVAAAFASMISAHIVNTRNLMQVVFQGPAADRILEIIHRHIQRAAKDYGGFMNPVIKLTVGSQQYASIKANIGERIVKSLPDGPIQNLHGYAEEAMDIERTLRERLEQLPREQFEGLLRPIFQEDEWKLILVGAVLGLLTGFVLIFTTLG